MYRKQLGEGWSDEVECSVDVPRLGSAEKLQLFGASEDQMPLVPDVNILLQEAFWDVVVFDLKGQLTWMLWSCPFSSSVRNSNLELGRPFI